MLERMAQRSWGSIALGAALAFVVALIGAYAWNRDWGDSLILGLGVAIGVTAVNVVAKIWRGSRQPQA